MGFRRPASYESQPLPLDQRVSYREGDFEGVTQRPDESMRNLEHFFGQASKVVVHEAEA